MEATLPSASNLVSPRLFEVRRKAGELVWFTVQGRFIQGKIRHYIGQIIPDEEQEEGVAVSATVSEVNYVVDYIAFGPMGPQYQVQMLSDNEIYSTLEELVAAYRATNTFPYRDVEGE